MQMTIGDPSELDALCNEILTQIEIQEAQVLSWGFVEAHLRLRDDFEGIINRLTPPLSDQWLALSARGLSPDDILTNLIRRRLLFESNGNFRTRFAETVRLLYLLRQRFSEQDWQTAKRLVGDLKIELQRRRYPQRNIPFGELGSTLQRAGITQTELDICEHLLCDLNGTPLAVARFQRDAVLRVLQALRDGGDRAIAIGAGTGAGKTKAFYVPAFSWIASHLDTKRFVKALALYPRTELLKDQLVEAFAEARKLDTFLASKGKRPLALAAYYGDTPHSAKWFLDNPPTSWKWHGESSGWICPYFFCPNPVCDGHDMVWTQEDMQREVNAKSGVGRYAQLRCPRCETVVTSDQLQLTREQMLQSPPDVLFTTTEMLNRRLSRTDEHALFGIDVTPAPRLLLLDEIHTYEGLVGAQVGYLLRRWRFARHNRPGEGVCIVGLSATLTNAEAFLAKLSGLQPYQVEYISPSYDDLVEEGLEYNLILKGDPVSGASLLSTSVQTVMLLGRMLNPAPEKRSGSTFAADAASGVYGSRIFGFADNLDVCNRWYHIEQSAEQKLTLSKFRKRNPTLSPTEKQRRIQAGQDWTICEVIGHDLKAPLHIDRVSSQSRGIRENADVIVATSALEVGFNDLTVGAVVQHKTPRSMASFLQRKGRAGRTRRMRPWTVVVTSAYGRDRWAFQHAENLFNPVLSPLELPLENIYVRKIQATFALMDWLSLKMKREGHKVDMWAALAGARNGNSNQAYLDWPRKYIGHLVNEVLNGALIQELSRHLVGALGLDGDEGERALMHILWSEPRSLMLDVLPTMLRQLESNWRKIEGNNAREWADAVSKDPLPDFVPPNLFSDLNVPDLTVHLPSRGGTGQVSSNGRSAFAASARHTTNSHNNVQRNKPESMQLMQGMTEFAPGRVSKRFATSERGDEAYWIPVPPQPQADLRGSISDTLPLERLKIELDEVPRWVRLDGNEIAVYRPRAYTVEQVPSHILPTSNAWLRWQSHFQPSEQRASSGSHSAISKAADIPSAEDTDAQGDLVGNGLPLATGAAVKGLIRAATAYSQTLGSWVDVTRLATGVRAELRRNRGGASPQTLSFTRGDSPAGLGFNLGVDALAFDLAPFDPTSLRARANWPKLYRHLGPRYFLSKLQADSRFATLSSFECDWLWQLALSMLIATATARNSTLREAMAEVEQKRAVLADRTMKVIFQAQDSEDDDEEQIGRLHKRLAELMADNRITATLDEHIHVLWDSEDDGLNEWLIRCYVSSAGAALFAAVTQLAPDLDPDELIMDVDGNRIWISEASAGGVGIVSRLMDALSQRPRDLELQLRSVLRTCDREEVGDQLHALAQLLGDEDPSVKSAFAAVRKETDLPEVIKARNKLAKALEQHGLAATRELIVAIVSKFLRPNSDSDSDRLIASLVAAWDEAEERLETTVDLRIMAVAVLRVPEIAKQLDDLLTRVNGTEAQVDEAQKFNLLQSLLWLTCVDSCPDCIEHWQPYQDLLKPSRALLLASLNLDTHAVGYGEHGWEQSVQSALAREFQAVLSCEQEALQDCKREVIALLTQPIESGIQLFYPLIESIERHGKRWLITMSIREMNES